jgi:hypothetical protein
MFLVCFAVAILLAVLTGISGSSEAVSVMLAKVGIISFMMVIVAMSLYWVADGIISFCENDMGSAAFLFAIGAIGISFAIWQISLQLSNDKVLSSQASHEAEAGGNRDDQQHWLCEAVRNSITTRHVASPPKRCGGFRLS